MPASVSGRRPEDTAPAEAADEVAAYLSTYGEPDVVEVLLPDTSAVLRGKWIPGTSISKIWKDGVAIPLSIFGLDIWGCEVDATEIHLETGDKDGLCWPVPGTLKPVPWAPRPTAQVLITMHEPDGSARGAPWKLDPRQQLAAIVDRFTARGLTPCVAFELEFYLLKPSDTPGAPPEPVFPASGQARQNMYAMSDLDAFADVLHDMRAACAAQGLPADTVISEAAPGQFEVNLYHRADPLAAADDALLLRRLIDGVARRHGLRATFMAKPLPDFAGNGMHVHVSLMEGATNLFSRPDGVGDRALRHAAGGMLATMADLTLIFVPSFNGYRRLVPGSYAPTSVSWGYDNRSVAVRVPNGPPAARRLEHRIAGAEAHPHLVLAAILAGMLDGLEREIEPPAPLTGNAYDHDAERLSPDMAVAVERFARSEFVGRAFGADYRRIYSVMKREEMAAFIRCVLPLEYETYL